MDHANETDSVEVERLQVEAEQFTQQHAYPEAIAAFEQMLALLKRRNDPPVEDIAACHNNIAWLYERLWDWNNAEKNYRSMIETADQSGTSDPPLLQRALDSFGGFLFRHGHYSEAEQIYLRLMQVLTKSGLTGTEDEAACMNELALVIKIQGRASEAEPIYRSVLDLTERLAGPMAPDTGSAHGNLALAYLSLARFIDARYHLDRMEEIFKVNFSTEHPANALHYSYRAMLCVFGKGA